MTKMNGKVSIVGQVEEMDIFGEQNSNCDFNKIRVCMCNKPTFAYHSIEAGRADGVHHFDHHGDMKDNPSPCNDSRIKPLSEKQVSEDGIGTIIEVTHFDADTFLGLKRMIVGDVGLSKVNTGDVEFIDNNSSYAYKGDRVNLYYMQGVIEASQQLKLPRFTEENECLDISDIVFELINKDEDYFIELGRKVFETNDSVYRHSIQMTSNAVGLFNVAKGDRLNAAMGYDNGLEILVVYNGNFESISIYARPDTNYKFNATVIEGVEFNGQEKACGSPRGIKQTSKIAESIFYSIAEDKDKFVKR